MTKIYGLVDPRDQRVRYVGKTVSSLQKRLDDHVKDSLSYFRLNEAVMLLEKNSVLYEAA